MRGGLERGLGGWYRTDGIGREAGMLDEAGLRAALGRLLPAGAGRFREFVVRDGAGRMRIGVLCTDAGFYAEVSNFGVGAGAAGADYCQPWAEAAERALVQAAA